MLPAAKMMSMKTSPFLAFASHMSSVSSMSKSAFARASSAPFTYSRSMKTSRSFVFRQRPVYAYIAKAPETT